MERKLLEAFERELRHIQEVGGEFVRENPKIGLRLGRGEKDVAFADPYVERLLEAFAFLAARIQVRMDAEFPAFTQNLLQIVYPQYLAPTPSMAVVELQPNLALGTLQNGYVVERDTALRSVLRRGDRTPQCEFRTRHPVTLWPLELKSAEYIGYLPDAGLDERDAHGAEAAIRLELHATAGLTFDKLALESLPLFLRGSGEITMRLYEALLARGVRIVARPVGGDWREVAGRDAIGRLGFEDSDAMLPYSNRSFHGYRLLHEYFACPERFQFVELSGLGPAVRRTTSDKLEVLVLLEDSDETLEKTIDERNFALFATPAVNLFPRRHRFHIDGYQREYRVKVGLNDASQSHYEIYDLLEVLGHETRDDEGQRFLPLYASHDYGASRQPGAYFSVRREPRRMSTREQKTGWRSKRYEGGSEVFLQLVDSAAPPYSENIKELTVSTLCTNRDLPFVMPVGEGKTDFTLDSGAPVREIRCLAGPTRPKPSPAHSKVAWRFLSHLSLNYLSLADITTTDDPSKRRLGRGAVALRELLNLYGHYAKSTVRSESPFDEEAAMEKQVSGIQSVVANPQIRRLPTRGPVSFGRVLEITVTMDEGAFKGSGVFLLGHVLSEFFSRYVSINSFTETVLRTPDRGEVMRWPPKAGSRPSL